jgi:hypothetical protein
MNDVTQPAQSDSVGPWLAHDDDNKVVVLYAGQYDPPKKRIRELTSFIRRGLTVRVILDEDRARQAWGNVVTEREMRKMAKPPTYSEDDGSAVRIAKALVLDA